MAERNREAEALMDEVRAQAEHMVQRTEIVRQANSVAQRILDDANEEARALRHQAEDFVDTKLAGMEIVLDRLTRTVQAGRAKLAAPPLEAPHGRRGSRDGGGRLLRPGPVVTWPPTPSSSTWPGCAARRGQPVHEVRRGEVALAGPLDEAGHRPGPQRGAGRRRGRGRRDADPLRGRDRGRRARSRAPWVGHLPALRRAGGGRAARSRCTSASPTPRWPARPTRSSTRSSTTTIDLGPAGPRRRRARAAHGAPVPGGLRRPVPPVRGQPQRGRLRLRCPTRPPVG